MNKPWLTQSAKLFLNREVVRFCAAVLRATMSVCVCVCMCTCASSVCTPRSWRRWRRLQPYQCKDETEEFLLQTDSRLDFSQSLPPVQDAFRLTREHWLTLCMHVLTYQHSTYSERIGKFLSRRPVVTIVELEAVQTLCQQADHNAELWRDDKQPSVNCHATEIKSNKHDFISHLMVQKFLRWSCRCPQLFPKLKSVVWSSRAKRKHRLKHWFHGYRSHKHTHKHLLPGILFCRLS